MRRGFTRLEMIAIKKSGHGTRLPSRCDQNGINARDRRGRAAVEAIISLRSQHTTKIMTQDRRIGTVKKKKNHDTRSYFETNDRTYTYTDRQMERRADKRTDRQRHRYTVKRHTRETGPISLASYKKIK